MAANEDRCPMLATQLMFWPGREPLDICDLCGRTGRGIADALGCYVYFEQIPMGEMNDERTCQQKVTAVQK